MKLTKQQRLAAVKQAADKVMPGIKAVLTTDALITKLNGRLKDEVEAAEKYLNAKQPRLPCGCPIDSQCTSHHTNEG